MGRPIVNYYKLILSSWRLLRIGINNNRALSNIVVYKVHVIIQAYELLALCPMDKRTDGISTIVQSSMPGNPRS